ncbi:MAG TPA: hypothetical protein VNU24_02345, partial [Solirubrobacteraceae bacterium]|nr:hypothetical protein [Solirubrobacteraceae bacterium]
MEFALILRELSKRRVALGIGVVIAVLAAILSVYRLESSGLAPRSLQYSSASTQVFVDTPSSVLGDLQPSFEPLQARATVYANFMASPTFLALVGEKSGIPGDQIYAAGPVDPSVPRVVEEPTAVQRNVEITGESTPYRLNFNDDPNLPTIGIYAQAPNTRQAVALANASAAALAQYVATLAKTGNTPPAQRVVIRQLGSASGGVVDGGISKAVAFLTFLGVFVLWCVLVLVGGRFLETWRATATIYDEQDAAEGAPSKASSNGSAQGEERAAVAA